MKYLLFLITLTSFLLSACHPKPIESNFNLHENWYFKGKTDSSWLEATVPGSIHTDLLINGKIDDPFYRLNEQELQWIDKKGWVYQCEFLIEKELLKKEKIELVFHGLDTHAKVFLNDNEILVADNMFLSWTVSCKNDLRIGRNLLKLVFESPINYGLNYKENLPYLLPGAENDQSVLGGVGDVKTCVFSRKAQYHFGWDWAPRLVSSGIWKEIELDAWSECKIRDFQISQDQLSGEKAELSLNLQVESTTNDDCRIQCFIDGDKMSEKKISLKSGENNVHLDLIIPKPELWWPNGLGDQHLYEIEVRVVKNKKVLDKDEKSFGLRTVNVIQEPDSLGKSFYFEVNGFPVFMKGANYIPQDVFLNRVKNEDYEELIKSCVEANFNMLRVWGGGIYEKDIFYELCDQYGILVWQDFMFACAMYPGNHEFLQNVEKEAIQNVKRLRNHPCIAIWCGNNEILSAWNRWGWKEKVIKDQGTEIANTIWHAYDTLFHSILPKVVRDLDPKRLYWSSSPSAGTGVVENRKSGDVHYWGVWIGKEDFSQYKVEIGRFMSEYGFQSFPDLISVKKFSEQEDFDLFSEVMVSHQRSFIGNGMIRKYMDRDYREPIDFPMFLYVNQLLQAEGIKIAIEAHRRERALCMGTLYWQLNDCWPAASWSGIDYYGRWKALHYFVKKAYDDLLISPLINDEDELQINVISDKLEDVDAILNIRVMDFSGNEIFNLKHDMIVKPGESIPLKIDQLKEFVQGLDKKRHLLYTEILGKDGKIIAENILYFTRVKELEMPEPGITKTIKKVENGISITVSCDKLAKNVYLFQDGTDGHFSDNYFDLLPGQSKEVIFRTEDDINVDKFVKELKLYTLIDSYQN